MNRTINAANVLLVLLLISNANSQNVDDDIWINKSLELNLNFFNISGANFQMGYGNSCVIDDTTNKGLTYDMQPAHNVSLTAFQISNIVLAFEEGYNPKSSVKPTDISWNEADAYAKWLSEKRDKNYRLPTEAEFEYVKYMYSHIVLDIGTIREWVLDYHMPYSNNYVTMQNPGGPIRGQLKVIRDNTTNRYSLMPDSTSKKCPPLTQGFRLVQEEKKNNQKINFQAAPFPQSAVKPTLVRHINHMNNKSNNNNNNGDNDDNDYDLVDVSKFGPNNEYPHFKVRFALPLPPENTITGTGSLVGLDPTTQLHTHSPGFEVMPNGDCYIVSFSSRVGSEESSPATRFIQARLRHGSEQWDMPEYFGDTKFYNDQSSLLWRDDFMIHSYNNNNDNERFSDNNIETTYTNLFNGGRGDFNGSVPFKFGISKDNGENWNYFIPEIKGEVGKFTAQPITTAFRAVTNNNNNNNLTASIFFSMDSKGASSLLWRSDDEGKSWMDTKGRTDGRHSTVMPNISLNLGSFNNKNSDNNINTNHFTIFRSYGGKKSDIEGWMPTIISIDGGLTWTNASKSPFPSLGANQRPCIHRLRSGHLVFVGDAQVHSTEAQPKGWKYGKGVYVALSLDNGKNWKIKMLPIGLPHQDYPNGPNTLGYSTVRQGKNGVIHILSTLTEPALHYELNEKWILSDDNDIDSRGNSKSSGADRIDTFESLYDNGTVHHKWSANTTGNDYKLHGISQTYHVNGNLEHRANYSNGYKLFEEFYDFDGVKLWEWNHDYVLNTSTFTKFWSNGNKKIESQWNNYPRATHLSSHRFDGFIANGTSFHYDMNMKKKGQFLFIDGFYQPDNISQTHALNV